MTDANTPSRALIALARERRQMLGLTQRTIADRMRTRGFAKWSTTTVSQTELGNRPLLLDEAVALSDILIDAAEAEVYARRDLTNPILAFPYLEPICGDSAHRHNGPCHLYAIAVPDG